MKWNHHSYPRGPRSCPSYVVSGRHHLIDPIRPTRGHIAISPQSGLDAMSSLCGSAEATREWFRAFAAHSFLTCRPLRPRGVRTSYRPNSRCGHGLRRILTGSTLPKYPQSVPRGRSLSRLHLFTTVTACQLARLPSTDPTGKQPSHRRLLRPGFRRGSHPSRRWDYDIDWTPLSAGLTPAGMAASFAALGWLELFAKPITHKRCLDEFRCALPILRARG
jgi:hypothetical protein